MKYIASILFIIVLVTSSTHADNEKKLSKRELIEQADYYFFKENFPKALELYNTILENYPKNHYIQYHQYVAHHLTEGREADMTELKEFEKNEGHTDKFYNYWLGRIHHNRYDFELAEEHFKAFLNIDIYRTKEILNEAENRLQQATKAKEFYLNSNEYEVSLMEGPINSEYSDISPAFFAGHDELLFVSSRPDFVNEEIAKNSYRIFHTQKSNLDKWNAPSPLSYLGDFTEKNAKIEVVNNDGRLFMYKENMGQGDLYFSQPNGDKWSSPQEFDSKLGDQKIESHFFINDGETDIFFSITTEKNDLDIYHSKLNIETDKWSEPIAIPGSLNSSFDEDSPFLSHDGKTLYFSSNRPESIGGFDVFKSEWVEASQSWGKVTNIGFPINTIDDEINFQLNEDNISGFLSSNRIHGKGDFDIYYFNKAGKVLASGKVYDKVSGKELEGIRLDFHPLNYVDETFRTFSKENGEYNREIFANEKFVVEIYKDDQVIYVDQIESSHDDLKKSFNKDFHVTLPEVLTKKTDFLTLYDKGKAESGYEKLNMLGSKFRVGKKAMLRNIYFDIHSANLRQESDAVLKELLNMMNEYASMRIQIDGHTDNTGIASANQALSKQRASSVKRYLVQNGIDASRVLTKGYGSSQPIASNDDELNGRELNRRIEVIVVQ